MRTRMNVYFPPALLQETSDLADRKKVSRLAIVEAAVASFLSNKLCFTRHHGPLPSSSADGIYGTIRAAAQSDLPLF